MQASNQVTWCFACLIEKRRVCLTLINSAHHHPRALDIGIHPQQHNKMAAPSKQATVYIVDLGSTMAECNSGRVETDLDFGMKYIWDKIATTMAANLKGGNLGVIGLRTDETNNPLDVDGYENLSVSIPLVRVAHFEQN